METYKWHIKCTTPSDYELTYYLQTTNRLLKFIFNRSKNALKRKHINVNGDVESIKQFDIPPQYINLIKTNIYPIFKKEAKNFSKDGIELLNYYVDSCKFIKQKEDWVIEVFIKGVYCDKRK